MSIGSRIKLVRGTMSQDDFADAVGVSKAAIGGYERDKQMPGSAVIVSICEKFDIEPGWLLMGKDPMRAPHNSKRKDIELDLSAIDNLGDALESFENCRRPRPLCDVDMVYIPLVEARISAGTGSFETGGDSDRRYGFRSDFLTRKGQISQMVLMRVEGDSMEPEIHHGDVVLIDQSQTQPRPGAMFAIGVEDLVYIKMVDSKPGKILLKSLNPAYEPLEIDARGDLADGIRIIGKAIWLGREMR
ncbi:XRE family transcriptional regulator [Humidesulfovibrio sp.]